MRWHPPSSAAILAPGLGGDRPQNGPQELQVPQGVSCSLCSPSDYGVGEHTHKKPTRCRLRMCVSEGLCWGRKGLRWSGGHGLWVGFCEAQEKKMASLNLLSQEARWWLKQVTAPSGDEFCCLKKKEVKRQISVLVDRLSWRHVYLNHAWCTCVFKQGNASPSAIVFHGEKI